MNTNKFTELYHEYKMLFYAFVIGLGTGILITVLIIFNARADIPKTKPTATVITTKGSPLRVDKIQSDKDNIILNTSYDGTGESVITIPAQSIPSSWAWSNLNWSIIALYGTGNHIAVGVSYRYERITFMALPFIKAGTNPELGVMVGASFSFQGW